MVALLHHLFLDLVLVASTSANAEYLMESPSARFGPLHLELMWTIRLLGVTHLTRLGLLQVFSVASLCNAVCHCLPDSCSLADLTVKLSTLRVVGQDIRVLPKVPLTVQPST